jgi:lipopolysaccharide transport system permease protein
VLLDWLSPGRNLAAGMGAVRVLAGYRRLLIEMTRRELRSQYAGEALGVWWAIGHPLFLMGLYVFVFAVVFRVRMGDELRFPRDYPVYLLAGLVPWLAMQQLMSRATTMLTSNVGLVKQVVFPLEVLPATTVVLMMVGQTVGLAVLATYTLVRFGGLPVTYVLLPVLLGVQIVAALGVAFVLSSIGVFVRDLKDVVQVFLVSGVYLMPILYMPDWIPAPLKPLLFLNPFSYMGWCFQDVLYFGRVEHPWAWAVFAAWGGLGFAGGYRLFNRLRPHFGNVL